MRPCVARIPLADVRLQNESIREELDSAVAEIVDSCRFIGGPAVQAFAEAWARFAGVAHAIPCSNGTEALRLALVGVLGEGDGESEVITVSHTFAATVEAIIAARYRPVLVDVDPHTFLMDLDQVEAACTGRTVAVVPVHLYGQMVDMGRLGALCRRRGLAVIEDAAQAHGAKWNGAGPGQGSDAATFSFFPGKNLGAWGDAGAVVCSESGLAGRIAQLTDHGRCDKYTHVRVSVNARMDALQAAVLAVKLRRLYDWNQARSAVAAWYDEMLNNGREIARPRVAAGAMHVYHQYVVQVEDRDVVRTAMAAEGIATGVHYPIPVHEQPAYRYLGHRPQSLPITHALCARILSLPMFPELSQSQATEVIAALHRHSAARGDHGTGAPAVARQSNSKSTVTP